jgi:hypothetical protein
MSFDVQKIRREGMRWHLLNALNKARPFGAMDTLLLDVMQAIYSDTSLNVAHPTWTIYKSVRWLKLQNAPMVIGTQSLIVLY